LKLVPVGKQGATNTVIAVDVRVIEGPAPCSDERLRALNLFA